jgi:hypothetical protein
LNEKNKKERKNSRKIEFDKKNQKDEKIAEKDVLAMY